MAFESLAEKAALGGVVGLGGYVGLNYLVFQSVGGRSYWEIIGYVNGMVRGAGTKSKASAELEEWKKYWSERAPSFIVNHFYRHGKERIEALY